MGILSKLRKKVKDFVEIQGGFGRNLFFCCAKMSLLCSVKKQKRWHFNLNY